jgi:tRNA threonylcarbamoyladenosine biosynthesis protein TsaE
MSRIRLQTMAEAQQWVRTFIPQIQRPCVVLLAGDLGSGKTQMVKWCLQEMGVSDVTSPTYAIQHQYPTPAGTIDHVDLYRVGTDDELESSGFWDLLQQPQGLVFIEWAARLPESVWPPAWQKIFIELKKIPNLDEGRWLDLRVVGPN